MKPIRTLALASLLALSAAPALRAQESAASFLAGYESQYQRLYYEAQQADWASNTHIVEGDTVNAARTRHARERLAAFVGDARTVARVRGFLANRRGLTPIQTRQLEKILYMAGDAPGTIPDVVRRRIAAETKQTETLYGFEFTLDGKPITPNEIDNALRDEKDPARRRAVWEASKQVGPALKPGLVELRGLRNETVRALGYPDFFTYQVSDYGMTAPEMLALNEKLIAQLWPLYRELHTWARYELAGRYGQPVPEMLPADWLPNRWGQDWSGLTTVQGLDVDAALRDKTPEWVVRQGESLYTSIGFPALPQSFWERSSLYPVPAGANYKKNTHASAWHLDLQNDLRSLMSVEPNASWFETANHELGHIYYYTQYSRPEVPLVLREGANRAYHEAIGSMMGLAAGQRRFLVNRGLISASAQVDERAKLLNEALGYIPFIPFSAGTMTHWEHDLYSANLSPDRFNARWWELARRYQGIVPPGPRGEEFADALTKTHINDDAAQYYDYALSYALLFQMHNHIARNILHQDPHDTDYFGNRQVGDFLRTLMRPGASRPWRDVLRETTGRELDAQAMVDYFAPLQSWLREQNRGRTYTLPEQAPN